MRIEPDIKQLFDDLGNPESFDYVEKIAAHIPFISITRIVGIPEKYWDDFKPVVTSFTEAWNPTISEERRQKAREDSNRAIDIIKEVIAERRLMPHLKDYDPQYYTEPENFNMNRSHDKDVLFGYGPRFCMGAALAKRQLFLSLSELFARFRMPNWLMNLRGMRQIIIRLLLNSWLSKRIFRSRLIELTGDPVADIAWPLPGVGLAPQGCLQGRQWFWQAARSDGAHGLRFAGARMLWRSAFSPFHPVRRLQTVPWMTVGN